jgi:hypothetical protein
VAAALVTKTVKMVVRVEETVTTRRAGLLEPARPTKDTTAAEATPNTSVVAAAEPVELVGHRPRAETVVLVSVRQLLGRVYLGVAVAGQVRPEQVVAVAATAQVMEQQLRGQRTRAVVAVQHSKQLMVQQMAGQVLSF